MCCDCAHLSRRAKFQEEIRNLERAKTDMQVEEAFLQDKFRQLRAENDRLKAEIDTYRQRLGNATEDYVRAGGAQRGAAQRNTRLCR